ncbi:VOC family protein [Gemmatimonas groenlandica]|uniref:VOC family protein n=1 Tax=Gemmatimonas groenlandica TaxID=2732249 RepID=UPI00197F36EE|nr:VOC family protein [Gemmatimonas groenlandica]
MTAIASDPQRNVDFYAGLLGLRLVKRTVNFDDPETYHLYYGDDVGSPGSIMTFFPWPGARRGRVGSGQVAMVAFSVLPSAIDFWLDRLTRHGIEHSGAWARFDGGEAELVISFEDHDGTMLEIVGHFGAANRRGRLGAPGIPPEEALRGFHGVTLWVSAHEGTGATLVETLGLTMIRDDGETRRYLTAGEAGQFVTVHARSGGRAGMSGAGTVHHVAWAVESDSVELEVRERVERAGLSPTSVIDRTYFRSVYFREQSGILFELATNQPGFLVDEPMDTLGEQLMLPPRYESAREAIESVLPPLHLAPPQGTAALDAAAAGGPEDVSADALGFAHRYLPPTAGAESVGATTLLLLHGTGGDEEDLIPLGRELLPGAGLLSPRGQVLENGAPRFFRRLAEGVFDQEDLAKRTDDLAVFIRQAIVNYRLEKDGVIAVGFSNGANIAASLLLKHPGLLRAAVLLSPMIPFRPDKDVDLSRTPVFIGASRADHIVPPDQTTALASMLRDYGAEVMLHWGSGGHAITQTEIKAAGEWLVGQVTPSGV